ncbi:MAG: nicotinate (nicotinamide) nucleotide adenylyltransferase [Bacteroidales bacterium]|nr:nicotinate (nicotinamide) nucleotide adenylyltransferase [Bacteroidales bacterium]
MSNNIVLFFGSFNPPHVGHFVLANYVLNLPYVNEVWFVVSPQNPLKNSSSLAPARTRLEMVRRAIGNFPYFKPCDIEFYLPPPHYTIHTLIKLEEKYSDKTFYLLMGSDNLQTFHKWKSYQTILDYYHILVYPRKGFENNPYPSQKNIIILDGPLLELSSSYVRELISQKKNFRFMVPEPVYQMIVKENLYF